MMNYQGRPGCVDASHQRMSQAMDKYGEYLFQAGMGQHPGPSLASGGMWREHLMALQWTNTLAALNCNPGAAASMPMIGSNSDQRNHMNVADATTTTPATMPSLPMWPALAAASSKQRSGGLLADPWCTGGVPKDPWCPAGVPKDPWCTGGVPKDPWCTGGVPKDPWCTSGALKGMPSHKAQKPGLPLPSQAAAAAYAPPEMLLSEMEDAWGRDDAWISAPAAPSEADCTEKEDTSAQREGSTGYTERDPFADVRDMEGSGEAARDDCAVAGDACSGWEGARDTLGATMGATKGAREGASETLDAKKGATKGALEGGREGGKKGAKIPGENCVYLADWGGKAHKRDEVDHLGDFNSHWIAGTQPTHRNLESVKSFPLGREVEKADHVGDFHSHWIAGTHPTRRNLESMKSFPLGREVEEAAKTARGGVFNRCDSEHEGESEERADGEERESGKATSDSSLPPSTTWQRDETALLHPNRRQREAAPQGFGPLRQAGAMVAGWDHDGAGKGSQVRVQKRSSATAYQRHTGAMGNDPVLCAMGNDPALCGVGNDWVQHAPSPMNPVLRAPAKGAMAPYRVHHAPCRRLLPADVTRSSPHRHQAEVAVEDHVARSSPHRRHAEVAVEDLSRSSPKRSCVLRPTPLQGPGQQLYAVHKLLVQTKNAIGPHAVSGMPSGVTGQMEENRKETPYEGQLGGANCGRPHLDNLVNNFYSDFSAPGSRFLPLPRIFRLEKPTAPS